MNLIPVLDVRNGVVVRGIGGRRTEYRPIVSRLTRSIEPVEVARALVAEYRPSDLYLADLDAIEGARPAWGVYTAIRELGARLWVDAGVADAAAARVLAECGCDIVAGLETIAGPRELAEIVAAIGADQVVFSYDLRAGAPLRDWPGPNLEPITSLGIDRIIVLDLAQVGVGSGTGTEELCRRIASAHPNVTVIAGGGISGPADLNRLAELGVRGAMVASALHDGRISPERPD